MLSERSSDTASFLEHPVYNILKIFSALILALFCFAIFEPKWMCNSIFFLEILKYLTYFLRPIPLLPWSMLFASIWDSFLAQTSVLLLCQFAVTLSAVERADLFLQSRPFENS